MKDAGTTTVSFWACNKDAACPTELREDWYEDPVPAYAEYAAGSGETAACSLDANCTQILWNPSSSAVPY